MTGTGGKKDGVVWERWSSFSWWGTWLEQTILRVGQWNELDQKHELKSQMEQRQGWSVVTEYGNCRRGMVDDEGIWRECLSTSTIGHDIEDGGVKLSCSAVI